MLNHKNQHALLFFLMIGTVSYNRLLKLSSMKTVEHFWNTIFKTKSLLLKECVYQKNLYKIIKFLPPFQCSFAEPWYLHHSSSLKAHIQFSGSVAIILQQNKTI